VSFEKPIRDIAVVGTGVIGASWAAQYLARGLDVVATDPAPNAVANLRKYVDEAWGQLEEIGLSPGASRPLELHQRLGSGVRGGRLRPGKRPRAT
jgi:3-hydroxyacyl-CoA dehydrogenase